MGHHNAWGRLALHTALLSSTLLFVPWPDLQAARPLDLGDQAFWRMEYQQADSLYSLELQESPANAELFWKLARLHVSMGESLPRDETKKRVAQYYQAVEYARRSVSLDSTNAKGHAWLAASLAMAAEKTGTREKLEKAEEIKRELDTAIRLNPNEQTALSMLGSYYRQAAGIGWFSRMMGGTFMGKMPKGEYREAEQAFRKAIMLDPKVIRNYHELALVLVETDRKKEAALFLAAGLEKPILFASDRRRITEMKQLLNKLKKEE